VSAGDKAPVFIFEEFHTSRIGQLQIAVMLLRLHDKYGLKKIGLEGAIHSGRPLDAAWFRNMGGPQASQQREDLAIRMLAEGEIGSSELMTLLFPDVEVYGIESASEYNVEAPKTNPEAQYLLVIAEKSLTDSDRGKVGAWIQEGKKKEAVEYMMNADPWVKKRYEAIKSQAVTSSAEEVTRVRELQSKAREVGAQVSPEAEKDLEAEVRFYETADQRSSTMINTLLDLPGIGSGAPSAMTIGAAHTSKVVELLTTRNIPFAVIRPSDLNPTHGTMTTEQFGRKSSGKWARNSQGALGRVLNGSKKPPPIIERTTGHSYASMMLAGMLIAQAARGVGGGQFPDNIWPRLTGLPDIRLDRDSLSREGYDVIYRAWLKQDDGKEKEVWARVGTLSKSPGASTVKTLEQKLLQASDDLRGGGGNIIPPNDLPPNSQPADDEGPRDGKRKDLIITRTGRDTLAVFAATQESVRGVGLISD
jgi:hypothetical protein